MSTTVFYAGRSVASRRRPVAALHAVTKDKYGFLQMACTGGGAFQAVEGVADVNCTRCIAILRRAAA